MQPIYLNEVISEVLKLVHSDRVRRQIPVTSRFAPDLPMVRGDRVRLQQVLINLIFNAGDAMANNEPNERDLTITTVPDGASHRAVLGFRPWAGHQGRYVGSAFRPFVTSKAQGLGIGLSICRSIVEALGGRFWAVNNPERGATFCVALPASVRASS